MYSSARYSSSNYRVGYISSAQVLWSANVCMNCVKLKNDMERGERNRIVIILRELIEANYSPTKSDNKANI